MTTRELFDALAARLVGEGWQQQGGNHIVELDDAMVHLDNRYGPAEIHMWFDHFIPAHLEPPLDTVDDYLREIHIELERWKERER